MCWFLIFLILSINCKECKPKYYNESSRNKISYQTLGFDARSSDLTGSANPEIHLHTNQIERINLGKDIKLVCEFGSCDDIYYVSWSHRPLLSNKRRKIGKLYYNDVHKKRVISKEFSSNFEIEWIKEKRRTSVVINNFEGSVQGNYYCQIKTFMTNKTNCGSYMKITVLMKGERIYKYKKLKILA